MPGTVTFTREAGDRIAKAVRDVEAMPRSEVRHRANRRGGGAARVPAVITGWDSVRTFFYGRLTRGLGGPPIDPEADEIEIHARTYGDADGDLLWHSPFHAVPDRAGVEGRTGDNPYILVERIGADDGTGKVEPLWYSVDPYQDTCQGEAIPDQLPELPPPTTFGTPPSLPATIPDTDIEALIIENTGGRPCCDG